MIQRIEQFQDRSAENYASALIERLSHDPGHLPALVRLGVVLIESLGQPVEGFEYLKLAVSFDPRNVSALFWSAHCMTHSTRDFQSSLELLERALEVDPTNAECNDLSASLLEELGAPAEEIEARLQRAVQARPDWVYPRYGLAIRLMTDGDLDRAESEAIRAGRSIGVGLGDLSDPIAQIFERKVTGRLSDQADKKIFRFLREISRLRMRNSLAGFYRWSA